jgi:sulfatase modifying factor 1
MRRLLRSIVVVSSASALACSSGLPNIQSDSGTASDGKTTHHVDGGGTPADSGKKDSTVTPHPDGGHDATVDAGAGDTGTLETGADTRVEEAAVDARHDASSTGMDGAVGDTGVDAGMHDAGVDASVCMRGAVRCSGNAVETCTGGQWGSSQACSASLTCVSGVCSGSCGPGQLSCSGQQPQDCSATGTWQSNGAACSGATPVCSLGICTATPPSCAPGGPGMTNCGSASESCCASLEVTGGTYYRTYTNSGSGPTGEADPATVSGLRLDKYDVTVGRFRQFVAAWGGGLGYMPAAGSGIHTHLNAGLGLANSGAPGTYEAGWDATDWNNKTDIDPTNANLACDSPYDTWTNTAGSQENLPINCVDWYEAYAFCIWDGGFLPSEAEWEYAAAGGSEQLEYPWGSTAPGTANQYAVYEFSYTGNSTDIAPVGTTTLGAGLWGHLDLAGNVFEWNLDWFATYVDSCTDCAYLTAASTRGVRGGGFDYDASYLLASNRNVGGPPTKRFNDVGFFCARTP